MGSHVEEVDWDRLDKNKLFIQGAGMFSGVTVALYPLSVIKTKQMTLPGISGGFQGFKQTASTIMRTESIPGFYRGFGTVICGTIPARVVYLTTLEWTKSQVGKAVGELGLSGPTIAGLANFAGGALASLATQSVTVPIDVISQKQMVHGDETVVARHQHTHRRTPPAAATATPAAAESISSSSSSSSSGGPSSSSCRAAGVADAPQHSSSSSSSASAAAGSSSSSSQTRTAATEAAAAEASTSGRPTTTTTSSTTAPTSKVRRIGSLQMVRLIVAEEGVAGLYRGFSASVATFVPSSAVWWGAYGAYQKLIWALRQGPEEAAGSSSSLSPASPASSGEVQVPGVVVPGQVVVPGAGHSTGEVVAVQVTSSILAGCTSSLVTTPLDLIKTRIQVSYRHDGATPTFTQVARQILREDGAAGFLRGAVPRMLNASLWGTCMVAVYEHLKRICAKEE
ncbi:hypothetical protein Agub_g793, partial [Astrephomene gubernaculifera]